MTDPREAGMQRSAAGPSYDQDLLERLSFRGKTPQLAIAVDVEEVYFHCAKAFKRSRLWNPDLWEGRGDLPTLGQMLFDQLHPEGETVESVDRDIEEGYRTNLY